MDSRQHFKYLTEDFSGEVSTVLRYQKIKVSTLFWTFYNYIRCITKGIQTGKNIQFIGASYMSRFPTSKIIVGDNCILNSAKTFNLIGINRRCIFSTHQPGAILKVGKNCGFSGTVIGSFVSIVLGDNIKCGANTLITDSDWHLEDPRSGPLKGILIEDDVWLGINVIVLKGVTIGKNSIIGANSVVTKSIPSNVVAAGNPCKIIKSINSPN